MVPRESRQAFAVISLDEEICPRGEDHATNPVYAEKAAIPNRRTRNLLPLVYLSAAILSGVSLLGKISLLRSLIPLPAGVLDAIILVALALPLFWPVAVRFRKIVSVAFVIGLAGVFLMVFPRVERMHSVGRGSDQPDCIVVASQSLLAAQWPYQRDKLWSKNPLSCGPGWVALQAPVVKAAGYRWNLVLFWACALAAIVAALGWPFTSALLALLALSPGIWLAAANGSDFLTFGIAITALYVVFERTRGFRVVKIVLLALVAQFRFPTLLAPAFLRKQVGRKGTIWASALAVGCELIFLFWNTKSFIDDGPLHLFYKLTQRSVLSTNPMIVAAEVIVPLACAILAVIVFEEHTRLRESLLLFLGASFFAPAILDLVTKYRLYGSIPKVLEFWEGSVWICGCLPLAAAMLLLGRRIGVDGDQNSEDGLAASESQTVAPIEALR